MFKKTVQKIVRRCAELLSTDFCPSANRWVYWLKNPSCVLLLAIAGSATCGAILNPMIFVVTGLLALTTLIGCGLPWVAIKAIACEVIFDVRRVRFGEPALVRLRIRNRSFLPVWGLSLIEGFTSEERGDSLNNSDEGLAFGRIRGRSTVEYTWPFLAKRRGLFPVNQTARVETSFPFGLLRAQREADVVGQLIVWPETVRLDGLPDSAECESAEDQFSDRRVGEFGDMLGTRLFRQGDSLRRVHWAQTARQQTLIVTERQAPVTTVARVILDLSADSHPEADRQATVEQCVRVAASVVDSLHDQHCRVELQLGDDLFVGGQGTGGLERLMDALAVADVVAQPISLSSLERESRGGFGLLVTTEHGPATERLASIRVTAASSGEADATTRDAGDVRSFSAHAQLNALPEIWTRSVS